MNSELQFIIRYTEEHGFSPTLVEIAEEFNYSTTTAWRKMQKFIAAGLLERGPGMPRTLVVKTVMPVQGWEI